MLVLIILVILLFLSVKSFFKLRILRKRTAIRSEKASVGSIGISLLNAFLKLSATLPEILIKEEQFC